MGNHVKGTKASPTFIQGDLNWNAWCYGEKDVLYTPGKVIERKCEA